MVAEETNDNESDSAGGAAGALEVDTRLDEVTIEVRCPLRSVVCVITLVYQLCLCC